MTERSLLKRAARGARRRKAGVAGRANPPGQSPPHVTPRIRSVYRGTGESEVSSTSKDTAVQGKQLETKTIHKNRQHMAEVRTSQQPAATMPDFSDVHCWPSGRKTILLLLPLAVCWAVPMCDRLAVLWFFSLPVVSICLRIMDLRELTNPLRGIFKQGIN